MIKLARMRYVGLITSIVGIACIGQLHAGELFPMTIVKVSNPQGTRQLWNSQSPASKAVAKLTQYKGPQYGVLTNEPMTTQDTIKTLDRILSSPYYQSTGEKYRFVVLEDANIPNTPEVSSRLEALDKQDITVIFVVYFQPDTTAL